MHMYDNRSVTEGRRMNEYFQFQISLVHKMRTPNGDLCLRETTEEEVIVH